MTPSGELTFGSVCSGIGSPEVAWHVFGWRSIWMSEVDRAASEVLAFRFPGVPNLGDMTTLPARILAREVDAPDILVGGTPCQSFSVAGLRKGLGDARGNLALVFIQLANAIDEVRREDGKEPCIVVFENVPGLLTSRDNAFGCFLAGLAGESDALQPPGRKWTNAGCVCGPQRAAAWIIKDAQYFGLAQRRRRVFVVASAREGFDPAAILFEFDGVRRDCPPSRKTGEEVAATLDARTDGGGFPGTDGACGGHVVPANRDAGFRRGSESSLGSGAAGVAATLDASYSRLQSCSGQDANHGHSHLVVEAYGGNNQAGPIDVATARNAHGGPHGRLDFETETFVLAPVCVTGEVTHTLNADGFDASEDGTGRGQPIVTTVVPIDMRQASRGATMTNNRPEGSSGGAPGTGIGNDGDPSPTVSGSHPPVVAYAIQERAISENPLAGPDGMGVRDDDVAYTMEARPVEQAVAYALTGFANYADTPATLRANGGDQAGGSEALICFSSKDYGADASDDIAPTLRAGGHTESHANAGIPPAVAYSVSLRGRDGGGTAELGDDLATCLRASGGGGDKPHVLTGTPIVEMAVRRLMPVECERLQGFPDGWTRVPVGKTKTGEIKWAADGPRYKQLGNSMATRVMHWIGCRIQAHLMRGHNGGPPLDDFDSILG